MTAELTDSKLPQTLLEAIQYFSDPDVTLAFAVKMVWPDDVTCLYCKSKDAHFISTRRIWRCRACKKQYSIKVGTIFEDSPLGLDKWLTAIWLIANAKNGLSSWEVHRSIGVTQKTAWFMLHRIRYAMQTGTFQKMSGPVEVDETFVGGLEKFKHESKKLRQGHGSVGKAIVMGVLEREGQEKPSQVRAKVVPDTSKQTLQTEVRRNVLPGSDVYSDAWRGYSGLSPEFVHEVVDHAVEYVRGHIHTHGLENFWCLLKRTIKGTYVSVDIVHLSRYLDEQAFRFNERKENDGGRFLKTIARVAGKRFTYRELTSGL